MWCSLFFIFISLTQRFKFTRESGTNNQTSFNHFFREKGIQIKKHFILLTRKISYINFNDNHRFFLWPLNI